VGSNWSPGVREGKAGRGGRRETAS